MLAVFAVHARVYRDALIFSLRPHPPPGSLSFSVNRRSNTFFVHSFKRFVIVIFFVELQSATQRRKKKFVTDMNVMYDNDDNDDGDVNGVDKNDAAAHIRVRHTMCVM